MLRKMFGATRRSVALGIVLGIGLCAMVGIAPTALSNQSATDVSSYEPNSSFPDNLTALGSWLYFSADDGQVGREIWRTNGAVTQLVSDINPDGSSYPQHLTVQGSSLYFTADDGVSGRQIWKTTSESSTAVRVTDLQPAISWGSLASFNSQIYFSRNAGNAVQLMAHNPTTEATYLVTDLLQRGNIGQWRAAGSILYFILDQYPDGNPPALWQTNGSETFLVDRGVYEPGFSHGGAFYYTKSEVNSAAGCYGPLKRRVGGVSQNVFLSGGAWLENVTVLGSAGSQLVLTGSPRRPGSGCFPPWIYGTDGNTTASAYKPDWGAIGPSVINAFYAEGPGATLGGQVFFSADDQNGGLQYSGFELWRSNGLVTEGLEGAVLVRDIVPGIAPSNPADFVALGELLFFRVADGVHGEELWRTDGTQEGTTLVQDINENGTGGRDGSGPSGFTVLGDYLYFHADNGISGRELWRTNGVLTELVKDIFFDPSPQQIVFGSIANRTTANPMTFGIDVSATSGLPVSVSATGACSITEHTVTVQVGTCTLTATQPGSDLYLPAAAVQRTFAVTKQAQSITFASIPSRTTSQPMTFKVFPASSSGLQVQLSASGACDALLATITVRAGTCTLTATQSGDASYLAAPVVTRTFITSKTAQTITFGALTGRTVLAAPATLAASATSGLTVSFASETPEVCTVSGTALAIADIGTCTVTATQSGDSVYLAALPVSRSFAITRVLLANKTVRFTEPDGTTPIVGATVTWSSRDGAYQSTSAATTNSSGNIVFKSIPAGTIDFTVNGIVIGAWSGYQEVSGFVGSAASTVRLAGNSYSYFTTTLTVQMPDGSPVVGAEVVLWRGHVSGSLEARFCRPFGRVEWVLRDCKSQGVTDASGRVTFRIIPTTLNTDCCGEGKRTWAQVAISDTSISYTTEAEVFDNVATAVIEIEQLPVVDMLAVDALVGYAAPRTITAVARDSSGDPMAGQALTLSASVSGASAGCSGKKTTATTGSTGIATFKVCPVKTAVWFVDGASIVGSSGVTLTVQATPTAPRSLTTKGNTRAVALVWAAPASVNIGAVTDYIVQYRLQGSSTWITFRDGTSTARKATVTGLIKGRVYEFRIAAKNKAGTGTWGSAVLGRPK
jgi:ELWxxDGT repeat protein